MADLNFNSPRKDETQSLKKNNQIEGKLNLITSDDALFKALELFHKNEYLQSIVFFEQVYKSSDKNTGQGIAKLCVQCLSQCYKNLKDYHIGVQSIEAKILAMNEALSQDKFGYNLELLNIIKEGISYSKKNKRNDEVEFFEKKQEDALLRLSKIPTTSRCDVGAIINSFCNFQRKIVSSSDQDKWEMVGKVLFEMQRIFPSIYTHCKHELEDAKHEIEINNLINKKDYGTLSKFLIDDFDNINIENFHYGFKSVCGIYTLNHNKREKRDFLLSLYEKTEENIIKDLSLINISKYIMVSNSIISFYLEEANNREMANMYSKRQDKVLSNETVKKILNIDMTNLAKEDFARVSKFYKDNIFCVEKFLSLKIKLKKGYQNNEYIVLKDLKERLNEKLEKVENGVLNYEKIGKEIGKRISELKDVIEYQQRNIDKINELCKKIKNLLKQYKEIKKEYEDNPFLDYNYNVFLIDYERALLRTNFAGQDFEREEKIKQRFKGVLYNLQKHNLDNILPYYKMWGRYAFFLLETGELEEGISQFKKIKKRVSQSGISNMEVEMLLLDIEKVIAIYKGNPFNIIDEKTRKIQDDLRREDDNL